MDRNDKLETIAARFLEAFRTGSVPQALARVVVYGSGEAAHAAARKAEASIPCRRWSFQNQMICFLFGHTDARGFRQWLAVGRHVKKGEQAFHILAPNVKRAKKVEVVDENGEAIETYRRGAQAHSFRWQPVFGFSQTEGGPLPEDQDPRRKVEELPLIEVARAWDLGVKFRHQPDADGLFFPESGEIKLGVENWSTWTHELVHAADHRRGQLDTSTRERAVDSEIVAELGGALLLEVLGYSREADLGGCLEYLERQADSPAALVASFDRLVKRTFQAVNLLLDTADELAAQSSAA